MCFMIVNIFKRFLIMSWPITGKLPPLFGSKSVKTAIFTSGKDKLLTSRRQERPRSFPENCSQDSCRIDRRRNSTHQTQTQKDEDAVPQSPTRSRVGSSSLLRWFGEQSGITDDLLSCMDEGSAKKVDTIAQFWLANQGDRLQRMQKWQFL